MQVEMFLGTLGLGLAMIPVARAMFPSPTDDELRQVEPPAMTARGVARLPHVEPVQCDYEGSVAQMVARGTGRMRTRVYGALRVAARHSVRVVWERPSAYVRHHVARGKYHETLSCLSGMRDFLGDATMVQQVVKEYAGRHRLATA